MLSNGTRLGPYEIKSPIGAGGMGEVYKARDTRLDRTVAIKVLPSHLSDKVELKQRFEREARAVSSLNHPHICTLHDIGHQDGVDFLVMEYLEGETLADRLKKGALPLEQALRHAIEIADALHKAHRQGVVHRDLKPGNIMLTKAGAKLLDFGLAKLARPPARLSAEALAKAEAFREGGSALPTEEKPLTGKGSILGTFQYMAPEQLEGREADAQTDLFAFGAVLHEMVTGRKAFEGKSQASLISAIMSGEPPPISTVQKMSPPMLDHLVERCLAKDPDRRWQAASDVMLELKWIAEGGHQTDVSEPVARRRRRARLAWGIVAGLIAGAAVTGITVWSLTRPADEPSTRFQVELSPRKMLSPSTSAAALLTGTVAVLSPDGTLLVYVAEPGPDQSSMLYVRRLDRLEATPLSGTEGARQPFFSPDGQWVAFFSGGKLKKVSISGGAPSTLCDAPRPGGGSWGSDDTIVLAPYSMAGTAGLSRVPAAGGTPKELTALGGGEFTHGSPYFLPGGKAVLFNAVAERFDDPSIEVISLATGERKAVHEGGWQPRYLPTGHLVYVREETLFAVPFDLDRLETTGPPTPIIEGVMSSTAFSETGTLVYLSGVPQDESYRLVWVDREGVVSPLSARPDLYMMPRLSPDGRRLAVTRGPLGNPDVWIYEMEARTMTRLTFDSGRDGHQVWSPDGERLAFVSVRYGSTDNLFWKRADGTGEAERLTESKNMQLLGSWSPDGKVLAFCEKDPDTNWDIWVLPLDAGGEPRPFLRTPFSEIYPMFSPDGRWLAYSSSESGRSEVWVHAFPGASKWQVSTNGGAYPFWAQNAQELFYQRGGRMMVVPYTVEGESFRAGRARELFRGPFAFGSVRQADIAPDGKRFVMLQREVVEEAETEAPQLIFVLNWFDEVKRLVPTEN
jgi:serine/threonine-protein kinase